MTCLVSYHPVYNPRSNAPESMGQEPQDTQPIFLPLLRDTTVSSVVGIPFWALICCPPLATKIELEGNHQSTIMQAIKVSKTNHALQSLLRKWFDWSYIVIMLLAGTCLNRNRQQNSICNTGWLWWSATWMGWLRFGMFHHPAWAVGSYSSGPPAVGTPQI